MGLLNNILGTISNTFSIGKGTAEVGLRTDSGILQGRNNGGSWENILGQNDTLDRIRFSQGTLIEGGKVSNYSFINSSVKWINTLRVNCPIKQYATDGYFDITMPSVGVTIYKNDSTYVTVTSDGIPISSGETLVYKIPFGQGHSTVNANFLIVKNTVSFTNVEDYIILFNRGTSGNINITKPSTQIKSFIAVNKDSTQNIEGNVLTKVQYNIILLDNKGEWNSSLYRYVSKSNQTVHIAANVMFPDSANNRSGLIYVYKNGTQLCRNLSGLVDNRTISVSITYSVDLSESDYLEIYCTHDDAGHTYAINEGCLQIITLSND